MSDQPDKNGSKPDDNMSLEKAAMQDHGMQDVHAQLMREKEEPKEGFSPIPIVLIFMFAALCFWGGVYLVENSGGYSWKAYDPDYVENAGPVVATIIPLPEIGAKIYRNQCSQCHQANGEGVPGVYPTLVGADWVTGHREVVSRILINGLVGPIVVNGKTYNGNMPAFGPNGLNLKPREIAGVLTFIRQEWGNDAPEITESMVATYLNQYSGRGTPWTAEELKEDLSPEPEAAPAPVAETTAGGD